MGNISYDDLASLNDAFNKTPKPKLSLSGSLNDAAKAVNFGVPQYENILPKDNQKIKISISSPSIKKIIKKSPEDQSKLVQEADIEKLVSGNEFSSQSISFIPYNASFITAAEALDKIKNDYKIFYAIEENYLSKTNLEFILSKIDKIYNLSQKDQEILKNFYKTILDIKNKNSSEQTRAEKLLEKIKTKVFKEKLGTEITRMIKDSGDLYKYYVSIDLVDPETKNFFLHRISEIDYYILKKIKELVGFTKTDLIFRFDEIIDFVKVIDTRNILMENFHQQVEQLVSQKKAIDLYNQEIAKIINSLESLARDYGRLGTYGKQIYRSDSLLNQTKNNYFQNIATLIHPYTVKAQSLVLDIETGNYTSLEKIKNDIGSINLKEIQNKCEELFTKTLNQKIK